MNPKQQRKSQRTGQRSQRRPNSAVSKPRSQGAAPRREPSQKKSGNVHVLRPQRQARTRVNYGRVMMAGVIVYFVVWSLYPMNQRIQQGRELEKMQQQLASIKKQNERLENSIKFLGSDEYVEQKARSLGLSKPDEEVVVVIPPDSKRSGRGKDRGIEDTGNGKQSQSLWERFLGVLQAPFH